MNPWKLAVGSGLIGAVLAGAASAPAPAGSQPRYSIVNPNGTLVVKTTFLLDTSTGRSWQLVQTATGESVWEEVNRRSAAE